MAFKNDPIINIIKEYRLLWAQHSEWTQMVINGLVLQTPNTDAQVKRLLKNPFDLGKALEVFYGPEQGAQFATLLTEHLQIAAKLVTATASGDKSAVRQLTEEFFQNGNEIALFLGSGINPFWGYQEWKEMFFTHLSIVQELIRTMVAQEYEENNDVYDYYEAEIMEMADEMSNGIIRQFYCCH